MVAALSPTLNLLASVVSDGSVWISSLMHAGGSTVEPSVDATVQIVTDEAVSVAFCSQYHLIAIGVATGEVLLYDVSPLVAPATRRKRKGKPLWSGLAEQLTLSHCLPSDDCSPVTALEWSPDGSALAFG